MDYVRQQLSGSGGASIGTTNKMPIGRAVPIHPGQVEEAVHVIDNMGAIDLSRLRFSVADEEDADGVDSVLDVAIFQVPPHCNSQLCDLSEYGIGKLEQFDGASYLSLCNNDGRLQIDRERFRGHHAELLIPNNGPVAEDRIVDGAEVVLSERDRTYEVMIANCNKQGKQVNMAGQVIFQSFGRHSSDDVDATIGMHLLMIGVAICLFFSICNLRISMGTRAEYTGTRLLPLFRDGAIAHEEYRVVRRQESSTSRNTEERESDSDHDVGSVEDGVASDDQRVESRQLEPLEVV